jgi:neurotransmitter:Na+ symporter, NSS family
MGSIHCYASYLREKDDIVLTGSTAAWTNEFCEVILGGTILLPIAVAYLGLDQVKAMTAGGSGFGIGFMTFPTLFQNWGAIAPAAGFLWFGLLFFAAITSSLAMGQPIMAFLQTEFGFSREKSAIAFGCMLLPLAAPVAFLHSGSFFDEFDYWAGTFALVVLATIETILFAWVFGMDRAWAEIAKGGEMRVPGFFFPIIKYVTPTFLLLILFGYTFQPEGLVEVKDPATGAVSLKEKGWEPYLIGWARGEKIPAWRWSSGGMIGKLLYADLRKQEQGLRDKLEGSVGAALTDEQLQETKAQLEFLPKLQTLRTIDRGILIGVFVFLSALVAVAWNRRAAKAFASDGGDKRDSKKEAKR